MNPTESTAPQGDAELNATSSAAAPALGLTAAELEELDNLLDDLRTRGEEIPQWEFCDGFMTAVICSRRPIAPAEYLPMLLGDGAELEVAEGEPLPLLPAFADAAQQARFLERLCCTSRKADEITPAPDAAMPWHPRAPCSGARVA